MAECRGYPEIFKVFVGVFNGGSAITFETVEPQPARRASSILEYITKDKEKVCYDNEGNKKRSYTSGRRSPLMSNPNFPDPIPYADTTDEDSDG